MAKKLRWLEPNLMSDEDKATLARIARERHMTVEAVLDLLEAEQEKLSQPPPSPFPAKYDPPQLQFESRPLDPEPPGMRLGYELEDRQRLEPAPPAQPDPRLVEIARSWERLTERDREELLLTARMKVYLNSRGG